jgi:cytochrome P450
MPAPALTLPGITAPSSACRSQETPAGLTETQLLHQCIFLLNAGHETTTNLIGNTCTR